MDPQACIPRTKHDTAAVERAASLAPEDLAPILPDLLEWVQDANWPVATPVATCLAAAGPAILPHLRGIFAGDDALWKYWAIELVVTRLPPALLTALRPDLAQLANAPAPADHAEEVHLVARAALAAAPG